MAGRGGREHSRAAEGLAAALTLFCFHVRLRLALWPSCLPMPGFFPRYPSDIRQPHNLADSLARHLVSAAACSRETPHASCDVYNVGLGCLAPGACCCLANTGGLAQRDAGGRTTASPLNLAPAEVGACDPPIHRKVEKTGRIRTLRDLEHVATMACSSSTSELHLILDALPIADESLIPSGLVGIAWGRCVQRA
jgi:hypothetical protein